jgi:hypothetical protein
VTAPPVGAAGSRNLRRRGPETDQKEAIEYVVAKKLGIDSKGGE